MVQKSQTGQRVKTDRAAARLRIEGRVQGVGYSFFAEDAAQSLELQGWVRNTPEGHVESHVEGPREPIEEFIERLRKGPTMARVERIDVEWLAPTGSYSGFSIIS